MNSRMLKARPRLVPKEDYQPANANLWIDDKESDITSVSSASSEDSGDSMDDSTMTDDMDHTENPDDDDYEDEDNEDDEDDEDDDEDDNESRMEQTLEPNPTEITKESCTPMSEVTPLFKAIDGEEWDSVLSFLETGSWGWKWSSLCAQLYQVSEKSADEQVRTWVTANKKDSNKQIRRLPLHAAISKGASFKIIEALIMHYSKGARNPDSEGNYPLHLAFEKCADIETLTFLTKEFPQAVHIQNEMGKVPTECGSANGLAEFMQLGVNATKTYVEDELTKEKGNLEEDRKQLLEVTKELMNLKKIVAERERNMTKDNFLYQKQHLNTAISQLSKLKTDLDKHEDNVLQTHLVAEKKRMDGVLGELHKTKGELEMIKSEKNQGGDASGEAGARQQMTPSAPTQQLQKKKKSKKSKKIASRVETDSKPKARLVGEADKGRDEPEATAIAAPASPRDATTGAGNWQETSMLTVDTSEQQEHGADEALQQDDSLLAMSPSSTKADGRSPTKKNKKNVAARFKKKMNWLKEKQLAAETE